MKESLVSFVPQSEPLLIYVADDDPDDLDFLTDAFRSIGFNGRIHTFQHGLKMWDALRSEKKFSPPHLFIIDINMPVLSGFELIKKLNENDVYIDVPKIVLSTSNNLRDIVKCKELNCIAFFEKPSDLLKYNLLAVKIMDEFQLHSQRNLQN